MSDTSLSAEALRSSWRKVSSTDNLQAFNVNDDGQEVNSCRPTRQAKLLGLGMISLAALLIVAQLAVLVCKALPPVSYQPVQTLQADQYYTYLIPLMVPMVLVAVTVNWFSLKLFKHNS